MYGRKRQIPRHRGEQLIGGALAKGALSGLKSLGGQLLDGKKGVDFSQVGKDALGGAASTIPLVGGMLQNKITGGGAQAQTPGQAGVAPAAPGPGGFNGFFGQGGGAGLMNLAQNALGMEAGGGIPHNPELAGAPYKMRGVRLMKSGGINEYGAGGNIYATGGVNTTGAQSAQTDGDIMRQEMLAQRQSERDMANSGGLGRRALDMSRGVDMDRGVSGQLDSGAAYSGPKYRMAELNEISRGVYGKDIDYDRLAASMGNASSKHKSALSNILANQTAMNQQRMGGVVLKKKTVDADGGALSDPPRADFLTKSVLDEAEDRSRARSDRQSAFGTSSTDVYMPVGDVPIIDSSEDLERPGSVDPLERMGPRLIKRGEEKGLVGGYKEMPDTKKGPSADLIYFNPKTSNIRTFIPTDDDRFDGARPFGERGFEDEDKIPYGFRENGKSVYATPAALDKMKEEGVGARGAAAEDYMMELYRSNPDLFTTSPQGGHRSKIQIQQRVLNEAKTRQPGVPGFYIPTSPSKASF